MFRKLKIDVLPRSVVASSPFDVEDGLSGCGVYDLRSDLTAAITVLWRVATRPAGTTAPL